MCFSVMQSCEMLELAALAFVGCLSCLPLGDDGLCVRRFQYGHTRAHACLLRSAMGNGISVSDSSGLAQLAGQELSLCGEALSRGMWHWHTHLPLLSACILCMQLHIDSKSRAAANNLPSFYSSKQGMTNENPAVFGGGGLALTNAGEAFKMDGDLHQVASDFHYAACALEPVELGFPFQRAGDILEGDGGGALAPRQLRRASAALRAAAWSIDQYGSLLCQEADGEESAGGQLKQSASHLRKASTAIRLMGLKAHTV
jgi:hypothetical protein